MITGGWDMQAMRVRSSVVSASNSGFTGTNVNAAMAGAMKSLVSGLYTDDSIVADGVHALRSDDRAPRTWADRTLPPMTTDRGTGRG